MANPKDELNEVQPTESSESSTEKTPKKSVKSDAKASASKTTPKKAEKSVETEEKVTKTDAKPAKDADLAAVAATVKTDDAASGESSAKAEKTDKTDKVAESEMAAKTTDSDPKVTAKTSPEKVKKPINYKSIGIKVLAGVVGVLAVVILVFGVLIYGFKSESKAVFVVSGVIPYPVEKVNGSFVSYHAYLFEVDANKRAYQNNAKLNNQAAVDFKTAEGKKLVADIKTHALDKLKTDAIVAQLAKKNKVTVTPKEVNSLINDLYTRYGGKDTLLKTLKQIYGWNLSDLKSVIAKQLLAQKVQEKISADPTIDAQAKAKAQDVVSQLRAGGDFATIAKKYSQSSDASTGGDLGTFTKGQVQDEIQKAIDALPVGGISDPIKTQYGYEVIKVIDKSGDSYHVEHILIKTVDYTVYLNDKEKSAKVTVFVK